MTSATGTAMTLPIGEVAASGGERPLVCGPLRRNPHNGRYFADALGRTVYLAGSHTWHVLIDQIGGRAPLDYPAFLDELVRLGHNFTRLWAAEHALVPQADGSTCAFMPLPFARPGPGVAFDGMPKFDLTRFNQEYIERLRARVLLARARGIYVAVMLFEGWGVDGFDKAAGLDAPFQAWQGHPFHHQNNLNGIDGDPQASGDGRMVHTLAIPAITAIQQRYVRMVLDSLRDCDNVIYEIANEAHAGSVAWQRAMIGFIRQHEAETRYQHPVGITALRRSSDNRAIRRSRADWVSPAQIWRGKRENYRDEPPATTGRAPVLLDTDHLFGVGGDAAWVWKSFLRGYNPIYMDDLGGEAWKQGARQAMGQTLAYAGRVDLAALVPRPRLASSGYCLAHHARHHPAYLVYAPGGSVTVALARGMLHVEWLNIASGERCDGGTSGGGRQQFRAPFAGDAVLFIRAHA